MRRIVLIQIPLSSEVKIANSTVDIFRLHLLVPLDVSVQQVLIRKGLRTLVTLELLRFLRRVDQLHVSRQHRIIPERDTALLTSLLLNLGVIVAQERLHGVVLATAAEQVSGHLVDRFEMFGHAVPSGECF